MSHRTPEARGRWQGVWVSRSFPQEALHIREPSKPLEVELLCGRRVWTEFCEKTKGKTKPQEHLQHAVFLASGGGEGILRRMWCDVFFDARELARIGLKVWGACAWACGSGI